MRKSGWILTLALAMALSYVRQSDAGCTIVPTPVVFASINPLGVSVAVNGLVTIACLPAASFSVDLSKGNAASFQPRTMTSGANSLNYNLYLDAGYSTIWGDNTGGTSHWVVSTATLSAVGTIYGKVPTPQVVAPGIYGDSVMATVTF